MILDFLVQTYQGRLGPMSENAGSSMQYDDGGKIAAKGTVIAPLLKEALSLEYFRKKPPKSTVCQMVRRPCRSGISFNGMSLIP